MNGTKAAFVERAIHSLKPIIYCYTENQGENFVHNLPQFCLQKTVALVDLLGNHLEMSRKLNSSQLSSINL